jgi:hypothetical protein
LLLLAGLALGVAAGLLTRRPGEGFRVRFAAPWLVLVALVVKEAGLLTPLARQPWAPVVYTASLVVLAGWAAWHVRRLPAIALVAAGMLMNLAVVLANGGRMPVSLSDPALRADFRDGVLGQYVLAGPRTRLAVLSDWIAVPPGPSIYSLGDLVAAAGMFAIGLTALRRPLTT